MSNEKFTRPLSLVHGTGNAPADLEQTAELPVADLEQTMVIEPATTGRFELSTDADGIPVVSMEVRDLAGRTAWQRQRIRRADLAGIMDAAHRTDATESSIRRALTRLEMEMQAKENRAAGYTRRVQAPRPEPRPRGQLRPSGGDGIPWLAVAALMAAAFCAGLML